MRWWKARAKLVSYDVLADFFFFCLPSRVETCFWRLMLSWLHDDWYHKSGLLQGWAITEGNKWRWSRSGVTSSVRDLSAHHRDSWQPFWVKNLFTNPSAVKKRGRHIGPEAAGVREFSLRRRRGDDRKVRKLLQMIVALNSVSAASLLFFSKEKLEQGSWNSGPEHNF